MQIRQAKIGDIPVIRDITRRAWADVSMAKMYEDKFGMIDGKPWYEHKSGEIEALMHQRPECVIVAIEEDKVVGYATYHINTENSMGMVSNNAVDPDYQGKGIGSALINAVISKIRDAGMRFAIVSTFEHDTAARHVYEKHGFKEIARSIHYTLDLEQ